jgi:hypothetical protein
MTTGALIFALNNEGLDYVKMAAWNSHHIRRHLGIPVAVITDDVGGHGADFDRVIQVHAQPDSGRRNFRDRGLVTWHNTNRCDAYDLTPWHRTLLLDADYIVASGALSLILEANIDITCHRWAHDITGQQDFLDLNYFGQWHMPMWWATVLCFTRCERSEMIFRAMQMIRSNWSHFRRVYGNRASLYRNDHALSIALNIENGHTLRTQDIPWSMATVTNDHKITRLGEDTYRVSYLDAASKPRYIDVHGQDLHVMAKSQLETLIADHA